jgi:hypothetical protein
MSILEKYRKALGEIPAPGGGGCHTSLLGAANLGIMAGLTDGQLLPDIRANIPQGKRNVPDNEITAAIKRARMDCQPFDGATDYRPPQCAPPKPIEEAKPEYLQYLIEKGKGQTEADFWEASPIRLYDDPAQDARLLLETLYRPDDMLFIGERFSKEVRPAAEWIKHIVKHGTKGLPHIIPNPVTGQQHPDKSGKLSFRCDNAIKDFRYAVVEFDNLSREDQLAFWKAIPLPIAALIDSGGKSIHGWIEVGNVQTTEQWEQLIENKLYKHYLIPLGVDPACRNEARLSRLPGHFRSEKGNWQKLLYLNADHHPR